MGLRFKDLPREVKDRISLILHKDDSEMTLDDLRFLRARRHYLDKDSLERVVRVINSKSYRKPEVPDTTVPRNHFLRNDEMSYNELQVRATQLGFKGAVGAKKKDLVKFIEKREKK